MQLKIGYLFQCPPRATPWVLTDANLSPCKGKSFKSQAIYKAFALTGRLVDCSYTQGVDLGWSFCSFRARVLQELLGLQPVLEPHSRFPYVNIILSPDFSELTPEKQEI